MWRWIPWPAQAFRERQWPASSGRCLLCETRCSLLDALCAECAGFLAAPRTACSGCAVRLPATGRCGRCLRRVPPFGHALAGTEYEGVAAYLVKRFKFSGDLVAGVALGRALAARAGARAANIDVLVPVPLHARRARSRGFDQALELARTVGRHLAVPVAADALTRIRNTPAQTSIQGRAARLANLRGAFHGRAGALAGLRIALVDDVMTSGASVSAAALAARAAGASAIEVWVASRASEGRLG